MALLKLIPVKETCKDLKNALHKIKSLIRKFRKITQIYYLK